MGVNSGIAVGNHQCLATSLCSAFHVIASNAIASTHAPEIRAKPRIPSSTIDQYAGHDVGADCATDIAEQSGIALNRIL